MIQPRTQTRDYWEHEFSLTESDVEQVYNHFFEVGIPQNLNEVTKSVMRSRIAEENNRLMRLVAGRSVYQPRDKYSLGDELVFPLLDFANGTVTAIREGHNPDEGAFKVLSVEINGKMREFACELQADNGANIRDSGMATLVASADPEQICSYYTPIVEPKINNALQNRSEFLQLGGKWFVKALLVDINVGHLHLAEAVLDMFGGGPLPPEDIAVHLDLDISAPRETQLFSLNYALLNDPRFDEVAPRERVAWFLHRMEPPIVRAIPERLQYTPSSYDKALLSPQMQLLEREIADEWSDLDASEYAQAITFSLLYPHRVLGTMPLNNSLRHFLGLGRAPRQIFTFIDAATEESIDAWVVEKGRYIYGFKEWYEANSILVGAYITLKRGAEPHQIILDYERKRPQSEDIRLATVADHRLRFELQRRRVGCGYDVLQVVGTDYTAAIDLVWQKVNTQKLPLPALIAVLLPELAQLSPQQAVHAKTIYSIVNMLRRIPPGPIFAELVRHPAFQSVGDLYWRFEPRRWRKE